MKNSCDICRYGNIDDDFIPGYKIFCQWFPIDLIGNTLETLQDKIGADIKCPKLDVNVSNKDIFHIQNCLDLDWQLKGVNNV